MFGKGVNETHWNKQAQGTAAPRKDQAELDLEWLGILLYMFTQQMFYLNYFNMCNFKWITHLFHIKHYVRHDLAFPWFLSSCWGHQMFNLTLGEENPTRAILPTPIPGSATLLAPWCCFLQPVLSSSSSDRAVDFTSWYYQFACVYSFWSFITKKVGNLNFFNCIHE